MSDSFSPKKKKQLNENYFLHVAIGHWNLFRLQRNSLNESKKNFLKKTNCKEKLLKKNLSLVSQCNGERESEFTKLTKCSHNLSQVLSPVYNISFMIIIQSFSKLDKLIMGNMWIARDFPSSGISIVTYVTYYLLLAEKRLVGLACIVIFTLLSLHPSIHPSSTHMTD